MSSFCLCSFHVGSGNVPSTFQRIRSVNLPFMYCLRFHTLLIFHPRSVWTLTVLTLFLWCSVLVPSTVMSIFCTCSVYDPSTVLSSYLSVFLQSYIIDANGFCSVPVGLCSVCGSFYVPPMYHLFSVYFSSNVLSIFRLCSVFLAGGILVSWYLGGHQIQYPQN